MPGWTLRVVPNKFPAFERQEVVVHSPRHARSLAELDDEAFGRIAQAWQQRASTAAESGFPYVQAIVNEGREAGASLLHSHSQLVWMREHPPAITGENAGRLHELLGDERYLVAERDGVVSAVHRVGRSPYELLVAPREPEPEAFRSDRLAVAISLVADALRRLNAAEEPSPANAWLHDGEHWHVEVLPRLSVLAGLELGAGIYLNPLPPEQAAATLRSVA